MPKRPVPTDAIYDEASVPSFDLPAALVLADGSPVRRAEDWRARRRPEIVRLFEKHVFGTSPPSAGVRIVRTSEESALGGRALRRQVAFEPAPGAAPIDLLVYLPRAAAWPVPVVLGPNFLGNHTVHPDPGITLPDFSYHPDTDVRPEEDRPSEASRGSAADRWKAERILDRGFALATFHAGDAYPDHPGGAGASLQSYVAGGGFTWAALATWAFAMSRALDVLLSMPEIDGSRIILFGHSRHGKAALWAGALDDRFALVISNNSGAGGAALMRRKFGERLHHLVERYPHWFTPAYRQYAGREEDLPVDQHMLLALIAPRPLYVASAVDDLWADPKGEFLSAAGADPVYRLLGTSGLPVREQPPPGRPVTGMIAYHIRPGGHGVTAYDWDRFLDFATVRLAT